MIVRILWKCYFLLTFFAMIICFLHWRHRRLTLKIVSFYNKIIPFTIKISYYNKTGNNFILKRNGFNVGRLWFSRLSFNLLQLKLIYFCKMWLFFLLLILVMLFYCRKIVHNSLWWVFFIHWPPPFKHPYEPKRYFLFLKTFFKMIWRVSIDEENVIFDNLVVRSFSLYKKAIAR